MRWKLKIYQVLYTTLALVLLFNSFKGLAFAADPTPTDTPTPTPDNSATVQSLQNQINDLQNKINDLQGQEKTLSSQIDVMDSQIKLTEVRIEATKQQINELTLDIDIASKKIASIEGTLNDQTKVLLTRIRATYEVGSSQPFQELVTSGSVSDFLQRTSYLQVAQAHDRKLILDTEQTKNDFANQKDMFQQEKQKVVALQQQLADYTAQLDQQKSAKQTLLSETQGSEANYQRQLAQAKAELASFSNFVTNAGGASILSGQTSCDGWGCYYNQRDSQWGNIAINGQSGYSMAGYGCLISSIAMVASHMGHNITPGQIATSSGDNFSVGTAMLRFTINVGGVTISRNGVGVGGMDSALSSGPVIVGIYAYGGTHFVVVKSGSNGNYIMNDPYLAGGHDVSFTGHYSLGSIF